MLNTIKHVKTYSVNGGNRFARFELRQADGVVLQTVDVLIRDKAGTNLSPREAKEKATQKFVQFVEQS